MKQLYAMILPVEGEIRKHELVMCRNGVCVLWGDFEESRYGLPCVSDEEIATLQFPIPAKMFIVSTDIEVGDSVYSPLNPFDKTIMTIHNIKEAKHKNLFKKIAPVSDGAVFVQKFMRITEDHLKWVIVDDLDDEQEEIPFADMADPSENDYLKVLCTNCRTFH